MLPALIPPGALDGGVAVVIDQLRASTTICQALASGATRVVPTLEPEEACAIKAAMPLDTCLTGGERNGVLIPGFDLDNSPTHYTRERVGGKTIAFTTTNGTKAAMLAKDAHAMHIGCLANIDALAKSIGLNERVVHLICAGTRDRVTLEDVLAAGAIAERLEQLGRPLRLADARPDDDQGIIALEFWRSQSRKEGGVLNAMSDSRGGRNLAREGLHDDIAWCARVNAVQVVPTWDRVSGSFVL